METGDREEFSIGREIECGHDGRAGIKGRMVGIIMFFGIGRRIILCALFNPGTNQHDVVFHQGCFAFGHLDLAVLGRDHFENRAFLGMLGNNRCAFAIAAGKQPLELGHHIAALGLGRLVAALAIGL